MCNCNCCEETAMAMEKALGCKCAFSKYIINTISDAVKKEYGEDFLCTIGSFANTLKEGCISVYQEVPYRIKKVFLSAAGNGTFIIGKKHKSRPTVNTVNTGIKGVFRRNCSFKITLSYVTYSLLINVLDASFAERN